MIKASVNSILSTRPFNFIFFFLKKEELLVSLAGAEVMEVPRTIKSDYVMKTGLGREAVTCDA